jgi:hypothetical protein
LNSNDAEIIRNMRRELGKRPVDTTRLDIQSVNGRVSLTGSVTVLRSQPGAELEAEMAQFEKSFARDRLIKEFTMQIRFLYPEKDDKHADPRGRIRH